MIRWKYVIPRGIVLVAFFLFLVLGTNPAVKWLLVRSGQQLTGAKVEIRGVNVSWLDGKLELTDIEFANPRQPMENMIQYESATLDLDPARLLHREIVIEHASIKNIQFGTPRTSPGNLQDQDSELPAAAKWAADSLKKNLRVAGQNWLEQIENQNLRSVEDNFETVRVARQVNQQWTQRYEHYQGRARQINRQVKQLKSVIDEPHENPLRDLERVQIAISEINSLQKQSARIRQEIRQLDDLLKRDRTALRAARDRDESRIRQAAKYFSVDADSTAELLLGEEQAKQVEGVLNWLNWFQDVLPDPAEDFYPRRQRGRDIRFAGLKSRPSWLIQHSEMSGRGMIGGQKYDFVGTVRNLSSQPELWDQPTQFDLQAGGPRSLLISATLDRRSSIKNDLIKIRIPELETPAYQLGAPGSLMVNVSPGKLEAWIELSVVGNELNGKLVLEQTGLELGLAQLNTDVGGDKLAQNLNRELNSIHQFRMEIRLSGKGQELKAELKSDLGQKVASAFGRMVNQAVEETIAEQRNRLEKRLETELAQLVARHRDEINRLSALLAGDDKTVAQLQKLLNPTVRGWNRIR